MNTFTKNIFAVCLMLVMLPILIGCKKYLDAKSNAKLVIPGNIADLQALLDYYPQINRLDNGAAESVSDNYYLTNASYESLSPDALKRLYSWQGDHVFPEGINDWSNIYDNVYRANTVIYNIGGFERNTGNSNSWDNVKGQALFLRAKSFLQIAWLWALAYDSGASSTDLGIPLRLDPDFNKPSVRSNLFQTYDQILQDLKSAAILLQPLPVHVQRACKPSAFAMIARTYLSMRQYDSAGKYADLCLQLRNSLLDYNNNPPLDPNINFPFGNNLLLYNNPEIIYECRMSVPPMLNYIRAIIDSGLYQSYSSDDLRKEVFFKTNADGTHSFKGSYEGNANLFTGIAVDEVYLIRAECYARTGNLNAAINDLNTLLLNRWKTGTFIPLSATSLPDALTKILEERRKELVMRGLRWMDIKRLNKEDANISLSRLINGQLITLPPNDLRSALAIPEDVIRLSGMQQNKR